MTYARRLFVWLVGYSILMVGCFTIFQYHREKEFKAAELNARLQGINAAILARLDDGGAAIPPHTFAGLRVSVIDTSGRVVYDNSPGIEPASMSNHLHRKEIAEAIATGEGYTVRRHSESTDSTYFYSATRGRGGRIVRTAVPYSVSLGSLLGADLSFLWIMGAVTIVMCVAGFFATRRLGCHIRRLRQFAESADRGERIYDTAPFATDELGAISNHIVRLYASQQQAVADRDREHRAALHQQQEKERIKKQLTNNINHELKTPVAAIQVCLETLLDRPDLSEAKRTEFLERCMGNARRLTRLLADVALLTRLDDAPATISRWPVDLAGIIAETADEYVPVAQSRGITIAVRTDKPLPMQGNADLLASVFRNLIDNAIAYSGCDTITISARTDGRTITATVADNGCGVAEEHLPRLFERFYRVDKGRSRRAGGTGLGLAIVKNTVVLHGGTINVSCLRGLTFTIKLPSGT